jgi:hypothetical protein
LAIQKHGCFFFSVICPLPDPSWMMDDDQIHLGWENGQPGEKEADTNLYNCLQ